MKKFVRPYALHWIGALRPDGRPVYHVAAYGIPSTDIDADAIAAFSDTQLAIALNSGLYEAVEPPKKGDDN